MVWPIEVCFCSHRWWRTQGFDILTSPTSVFHPFKWEHGLTAPLMGYLDPCQINGTQLFLNNIWLFAISTQNTPTTVECFVLEPAASIFRARKPWTAYRTCCPLCWCRGYKKCERVPETAIWTANPFCRSTHLLMWVVLCHRTICCFCPS